MHTPDSEIILDPTFAPHEIETRSFAIIDEEVPQPRPYAGPQWEVVRRLIHTTADFELLKLVRFSAPQGQTQDPIAAGVQALRAGARIVTDTHMARCAIPVRRLEPLGATVECLMLDERVAKRANAAGTTRARAAMELAVEQGTDIHVIGNAPTALLRLLELLDLRDGGAPAPALVVGMCVGFVNAAQSKALLARRSDVPFILIEGRKGGSALAGATVNALADMALARMGKASL